jgi:hypothetical protein
MTSVSKYFYQMAWLSCTSLEHPNDQRHILFTHHHVNIALRQISSGPAARLASVDVSYGPPIYLPEMMDYCREIHSLRNLSWSSARGERAEAQITTEIQDTLVKHQGWMSTRLTHLKLDIGPNTVKKGLNGLRCLGASTFLRESRDSPIDSPVLEMVSN